MTAHTALFPLHRDRLRQTDGPSIIVARAPLIHFYPTHACVHETRLVQSVVQGQDRGFG